MGFWFLPFLFHYICLLVGGPFIDVCEHDFHCAHIYGRKDTIFNLKNRLSINQIRRKKMISMSFW